MRSLLFSLASTLLSFSTLLAETAPSQLAHPDTIFYVEFPSIPLFETLFYADHAQSLSSPIVAKAIAGAKETVLSKDSPAEFSVPLALNVQFALFGAVETNLFVAAGSDQEGRLTFVAGGNSPAIEQSTAKLRKAIEDAVPGTKWRTESIRDISVEVTEIPGVGAFYLAQSGPWVLLGTSRDQLDFAIQSSRKPLPSMADTELWKTSTKEVPKDAQFIYFTRIEALGQLARAQKRTDLAELFDTRLRGLRGFAWSWTTKGRGSIANDMMAYTLAASTAAEIRTMVPPLGPGWRQIAGPNTIGVGAAKFDLSALASAKVFEGLQLAALLRSTNQALPPDVIEPAHAGWVLDIDPATKTPRMALVVRGSKESVTEKLKTLPDTKSNGDAGFAFGNGALARFRDGMWFVTASEADADYFLSRKSGSSPVLLEKCDSMPALSEPFLDFRLDRQALSRSYAARLKSNYTKWLPALRERGIPLPDAPPEIELDDYLGPLRTTVGFTGDNLLVHNSFQLGPKTGSTLITASSQMVEIAYLPEISTIFGNLSSVASSSNAKSNVNLFTVCLKTNLLFTALILPNQNSLFTDLFSNSYLGIAPDL